MAKFNSNQITLLEGLSQFYNIIIVIDNSETFEPEVYTAVSYENKTMSNPFFSIRNYRKITDIVKASSLFVNQNNALDTIRTQIENINISNSERKFSEQFQWIKF